MVKYARPVKLLMGKKVLRLACGGMHNAAITTDGQLFTWGCDDDSALGRKGDENFPTLVR